MIADAGIQEIHGLIEDFFEHDGQTAYIATSDHGMTNWGRLSSNGSLVVVCLWCGVWCDVASRRVAWRGVAWRLSVHAYVCIYVCVYRVYICERI